jgi:hypothetical protein
VISIAVLIGAALNAALDEVFPRLSGIEHNDPDIDKPSADTTEEKLRHRTLLGAWGRRRRKSQ